MKLIYKAYNLGMALSENQITVLSVENPKAYSSILCDIWNQTQGGEGGFILSKEGELRNIAKEVDCIFNPFALDFNGKRVINRLYQELQEQANTSLMNESISLNGSLSMKAPNFRIFFTIPFDNHTSFQFIFGPIQSFFSYLFTR